MKLFLRHRLLAVVLILISLLLWQSCYKFSGNQTIPAYLSIDSIAVDTYYPEEGTNSSQITDVWVYVDDGLLGVFELPALFPVLAEGKHKLEIRPGIKLNGISSTRVPYPFYQPIIYDEMEFVPENTIKLGTITTTYYADLSFKWMEDFEQPDLSFDKLSSSDTIIERTMPENNPIAFLSENSRYSGIIHLTTDRPKYSEMSFGSFAMPSAQGAVVVLEMDFKTDVAVQVGLLMRIYNEFTEIPLVFLNENSEWTKIYINLGPNISLNPNATDYKIIFGAGLPADMSTGEVLFDNIKIVSR